MVGVMMTLKFKYPPSLSMCTTRSLVWALCNFYLFIIFIIRCICTDVYACLPLPAATFAFVVEVSTGPLRATLVVHQCIALCKNIVLLWIINH